MDSLFEDPNYRPEGYPHNYKITDFTQLNDSEIKYIHDWFITRQFSDDPTLEGEDIRGVIIYPYKNQLK